MHRLSFLFLFVAFASLVPPSFALTPRFEHLTIDDGLPENSVRSILQDNQGFLWFGTHNGLARYDGYNMDVFLPDPDDSNSIFPRFLVALAQDDTGMIWAGSYNNGLSRYDPSSNRFTNYLPDPTKPGALPGAKVEKICPSDDGLWLALGDAGLVRFDGDSFHRVPIMLPDGPMDLESYPELTSLLITEDHIWAGTLKNGLAIRKRRGGNWRLLRQDPKEARSLPSDWITDIFQDLSGRIWIATRSGLALYRGDDGFEVFLPEDPNSSQPERNYLVKIDADSLGDLWIGSAMGLYHFSPRTGVFTLFAHDPKDPATPVLGPALSVLVDKSGIIWAGSWHTGLNKYDPLSQKFDVFLHDDENPGSLDDDAVVSIYEDNQGILWVGTGSMSSGGTYGGLNRQDPGTDYYKHITLPNDPDVRIHRFNDIVEDRAGHLWLGTNKGIWRLNSDRTEIIRPPEILGESAQLSQGSVISLLVDQSDRLWMTMWNGGLHRYDPRKEKWTSYWHDPRDNTSLSSNELSALCVDDRGRIWVGTDQAGLHLYNPETDNFQRFTSTLSGSEAIISLFPATDGRVWVGSSAGVLLVSPENWIEWSFTSHDGLPSDFLGRIQSDNHGNLWVSTAKGLVQLDPDSKHFTVFDRRDGLPWNELYFASLLHSNGQIMFGGHHGMISFNPTDIQRNPFIPSVVLTDFEVDDHSLEIGPDSPLKVGLQQTHEVILKHDQNNISIEFSSLHFAHPERNTYHFRLDPEDEDWRIADKSRTAQYTNLDPGNYLFEVKGSNSDGIWNPEPTTLLISILPPWWQTHTAMVMYVVLIALFIYGIFRQIVSRERIKTKLEIKRIETRQLQELDHLKSRFFANISHEFRTPLTLLKVGAQRLMEDSDNPDDELHHMMNRNANRLGQLIEQLLDLSRLETGHLPVRWQHGDWCAYLRDLVSTHKTLAVSGEILFQTKWPDNSVNAWFDPDVLEKVVGNLLTNALKFTPAGGVIEISTTFDDSVKLFSVPCSAPSLDADPPELPAYLVQLQVRNTGSFIPADQLEKIFDRFHQIAGPDGGDGRGTGIGLSLVRELVQWYGGSIDVTSDAESGTIFELQIPFFVEAPGAVEYKEKSETGILDEVNDEGEEIYTPDADGSIDSPTILIVEDHPDLRNLIRRELSTDYKLLEAPDGAVGLELARSEIPDLVLTDIMMPQLDGYELCRRLKTDERTNHIPVVMLTAKTDSESRLAGLEIGADDYLTKPFDVAELKMRLSNLLDQRRLLTERLGRWALDPKRTPEPVDSADEIFIKRAKEVVHANLEDSEFRVDDLCKALAMSRTQLHRKLKAITQQSTGEFMRTQRLLRAAELLSGGGGNVTEVAYSVGFKSLSHFAKAFREQFGVTPSEYG